MSSPLNPNKPRPPPVTVDKRRSLTGESVPRTLTRTLTPQTPTPQTPTSPGFLSTIPYTDASPSQEHLLPPSRDRFRKHYTPSVSSRRSSISSFDSNGDIRYGPYAGNDPFADSRAASRCGSPEQDEEDEEVNSDTIAYNQKFDVTPKDGILLYRDQPEPDDDMHDPGKDEDEKGDCNVWTKRGVVNVGVLVLFMMGLLALLVGYPIMMFIDHYNSKEETAVSKRSFDNLNVNINIPPPSLHPIVPDAVWKEANSVKKEESVHPHHHDNSGLKHRHIHNRRRRRAAAKEGVTVPSSREEGNAEST